MVSQETIFNIVHFKVRKERTESVFKLSLHQRVVNVRQDRQAVRLLAQALEPNLPHRLAASDLGGVAGLERRHLGRRGPEARHLGLAVGGEDLARLLERLVRQLLKGEAARRSDRLASAPRANGHRALVHQLLLQLPRHGVGVEIRRIR